MLNAPEWLIAHNIYYRNVNINHNVLALLPDDGDLSGLTTITVSSHEEEAPASQDADRYNAHPASTFVPMPTKGLTEQQTIRRSVQ